MAKDKQKITKRNIDKYTVIEDKLVYIKTGEVVDNMYAILDYINIMQEIEKEESIDKEYFYNNWIPKNKFTKFYHGYIKINQKKLSLNSKGLLFLFMCNVKLHTNEVLIDGIRPSNKVIMEHSGIKDERTLVKSFEELESYNLIKRIGNTKSRLILLNPYLCLNGKKILRSTVKEFYKE